MSQSKIKILGINGSPKQPIEKSNSYFLLKTALDSAQENGAETVMISLPDFNLLTCTGCEICTTKTCPLDQKDDYSQIEDLIKDSCGIIISSPSYWSGPPGILKNFMDRSRDNKMPKQLWNGKLFSAISVAGLRVGGQESVINSLIHFGLAHGMIVIGGTGHPWFNSPFPVGSLMYDIVEDEAPKVKFRHIKKDPISMKDAELLGQRMAEYGKKLFL